MKQRLFIATVLTAFGLCAQEPDSPQEISRETTIEKIGDYAQFAPAAASMISLITHGDEKGSLQFLKSCAANLAVTWTIKYAIDKPRPDGRTDGRAFPSGHTSAAFHGAAFLQRRYGWKYGIPAYVVAGFVAYSRLEGINERHDGWDVLGGIVVGVGSAYLFTTPYQQEHLELSFASGNGSYSIGVTYKF